MNGLKLLFWAGVYSAYNAIVHPGRRWRMRCQVCGDEQLGRSYNSVLAKDSLHFHFADGHPDDPDAVAEDAEPLSIGPEVVAGSEPEAYDV